LIESGRGRNLTLISTLILTGRPWTLEEDQREGYQLKYIREQKDLFETWGLEVSTAMRDVSTAIEACLRQPGVVPESNEEVEEIGGEQGWRLLKREIRGTLESVHSHLAQFKHFPGDETPLPPSIRGKRLMNLGTVLGARLGRFEKELANWTQAKSSLDGEYAKAHNPSSG